MSTNQISAGESLHWNNYVRKNTLGLRIKTERLSLFSLVNWVDVDEPAGATAPSSCYTQSLFGLS